MTRYIQDYIELVRSGTVPVCRDQLLLVDYVERVFQEESIYVDEAQLERYMDQQKYFPYRLLEWETFCFALHNCVYKAPGRLRWPILIIVVGRGAGKNGYLAFEDFCLITPINGIEKYNIDMFANSEDQAKATFDDIYDILESDKRYFEKYFTWNKDEVFYFHLASQDTASLLRRFNSLYSEALAEALDKYKHSGGRSGVLKITGNATKDKNYEENVARLMQNRFKTFFESKNAVIPLFDGYDYTPDSGPASQKLNGEVGDMESLVRQAQDRACNAYHCPPCLLRGDVTNQDEAVQNLLTFGVKPAVLTVENEANRKQYGREILNGWRIRIDMTHVRVVDIFDVAVKLDKLIQDAVVNTNEGRGLLNMDPISEPWADEYHRTKNMEAVNAPVKGGENT